MQLSISAVQLVVCVGWRLFDMTISANHARYALVFLIGVASPGVAQTRTVRETATAYGARLTARNEPADANALRINNRVRSRIENRISLRIERYKPGNEADPTAAFSRTPTDGTRAAPIIASPSQADPDQVQ